VELGIVHSVVCVSVGFGGKFRVGEPTMVVVAVQGAPNLFVSIMNSSPGLVLSSAEQQAERLWPSDVDYLVMATL
jgi:hypothetical protein